MREKEWQLAEGSLYYETEEREVRITRFQGLSSHVEVPGELDGLPVKRIAKKAFLSKKNLRYVVLPHTVEEVGDWAFAYCGHLLEVTLPRKEIRFGKAVFMECGELQRIAAAECRESHCGGKPEPGRQPVFPAELMAAAVTRMDAAYLLDIAAAGTAEWYGKWDARMLTILRTSDQEGYSKQILCGEEDYGSTDIAAYMSSRRKEKVRLIFLRLLFCRKLSAGLQKELEDYLRTHTKGEIQEEAWQVILAEHGTHREYYALFASIGCVTKDNINGILEDIGEEYTEMKAFFLRFQEETWGSEDFFAELEL